MKNEYGTLCDYKTSESIRPATEQEWRASREAEQSNIGGGSGVIEVDGQSVYVEGGKEFPKYTDEEIALEKKLSEAANAEGTIQAGDMLRLAPHHRPELHTTMSVARAFASITGKAYDTEFFS